MMENGENPQTAQLAGSAEASAPGPSLKLRAGQQEARPLLRRCRFGPCPRTATVARRQEGRCGAQAGPRAPHGAQPFRGSEEEGFVTKTCTALFITEKTGNNPSRPRAPGLADTGEGEGEGTATPHVTLGGGERGWGETGASCVAGGGGGQTEQVRARP